jgi:hypothetical protein
VRYCRIFATCVLSASVARSLCEWSALGGIAWLVQTLRFLSKPVAIHVVELQNKLALARKRRMGGQVWT